MTAHEAALRIMALYGWQPTTDRMEMGSINEKSHWDVLGMVESIVSQYGVGIAVTAVSACCAALCENCADGNPPVRDKHGMWVHWVAGSRVACRADLVCGKDAAAAGTDARTAADYACCCNGEGHEERAL